MAKLQKEYRTDKQFEEIAENCFNGNWKDAAKNCEEYGFYASDLIRKNKELELFTDLYDIAIISEMAQEIRNEQ